MEEIWVPVKGYEGLYEISNQGNVRSLDGIRWNGAVHHKFKGKTLTFQNKRDRYLCITLSKDGKQTKVRVHKLMAEHFLPDPPGPVGNGKGYYQVDHINDDPHDNRACNLQYITKLENGWVKPNHQRCEITGRFLPTVLEQVQPQHPDVELVPA